VLFRSRKAKAGRWLITVFLKKMKLTKLKP
jgi:hypothetical protein